MERLVSISGSVDESGSHSAWVTEGSLMNTCETQYNDKRTMGRTEEEEVWLFDG